MVAWSPVGNELKASMPDVGEVEKSLSFAFAPKQQTTSLQSVVQMSKYQKKLAKSQENNW